MGYQVRYKLWRRRCHSSEIKDNESNEMKPDDGHESMTKTDEMKLNDDRESRTKIDETKLDDSAVKKFHARAVHHDDPRFPLVPPDLWFNQRSGEYEKVKKEDRRKKYLQGMASSDTWRQGRYFVEGALHQDLTDFYILPMEKATNTTGNSWQVMKYRIIVSVLDKNGNEKEKSIVEYGHTPLKEVGGLHKKGLAKVLYENAMEEEQVVLTDYGKGLNSGSMIVSGTRLHNDELLSYRKKTETMKQLEKIAARHLNAYGFRKWVNNQMETIVKCGGSARTLIGSCAKHPWCTRSVVSFNNATESHMDPDDAVQGICIWHEKNPPRGSRDPHWHIKNWYFLLPDMEIEIEGKWHAGVAIPLRHGAVVTWDGAIVRHCTAVSEVEKTLQGRDMSMAWGTYFGSEKMVVKHLERVWRGETRKWNEMMRDKKRHKVDSSSK